MGYFNPVPDQNTWTDIVGKWLVDIIFILAFGFWITYMTAQQINVAGNSMTSGLTDGDKVVFSRLTYELSEPQRMDVIAIWEEDEESYLIKRIIGLPGETVQIMDGDIYIDGEKLEAEYNSESVLNPGTADTPVTLSGNEYFVMGDNWNNSQDSRSEEFGNIRRSQIVGKVWLKVWPFADIGWVS